VSDRIVLHDMRFLGRHGVGEAERLEPQPFAVDVEIVGDLEAAGWSDDLARTVDYGAVFGTCRDVVEGRSFRLIEALAEAIAEEVLATYAVVEVVVRVRKLQPPIVGTLAWAGVEIVRRRADRS
jgi:7,8-dihydroneopterin aldolase/epimerase/oxygenase